MDFIFLNNLEQRVYLKTNKIKTLHSHWLNNLIFKQNVPPSRVSFDLHSTGRNSTCVAWLEKCLSSIFLAASLILKKIKTKENSIRVTSYMHLHGIKCLQS